MHAPLATAFIANIDGARRLKPLRKILREHKPDLVVLEECPRWRRWFHAIPGYRVIAVAPFVKGDRRSTVTLARRGVRVERQWVVRVWQRWRGPHGNPHEGRAMTGLRLWIRGELLPTLPAHFPTKRGDNLPAWEEALRKAERFLERTDGPRWVLGDLNAGPPVIGPWARERGYDMVWVGVVDGAIGNGCTVTTIRTFDAPTGHGWGLFRIDSKEKP